jgi:hypothetical protein
MIGPHAVHSDESISSDQCHINFTPFHAGGWPLTAVAFEQRDNVHASQVDVIQVVIVWPVCQRHRPAITCDTTMDRADSVACWGSLLGNAVRGAFNKNL